MGRTVRRRGGHGVGEVTRHSAKSCTPRSHIAPGQRAGLQRWSRYAHETAPVNDLFTHVQAALAGGYAIERELGRGGMATVYLAQDLKHGRPVAIKVLAPELAAALGRERFLREIETAARLSHPHILPLHDSGGADGFLYYVMPDGAGEALRDPREAGPPRPGQDVRPRPPPRGAGGRRSPGGWSRRAGRPGRGPPPTDPPPRISSPGHGEHPRRPAPTPSRRPGPRPRRGKRGGKPGGTRSHATPGVR